MVMLRCDVLLLGQRSGMVFGRGVCVAAGSNDTSCIWRQICLSFPPPPTCDYLPDLPPLAHVAA